jgi:hypothetical protein
MTIKSFPFLLRTTSLSLLLACSTAPNLVYAMEADTDENGSSFTSLVIRANGDCGKAAVDEVEPEYYNYICNKIESFKNQYKENAPQHIKAFINGFANRAADALEVAAHNLTVHYGTKVGETILTKLNDFLVPLASEKAIEWKLAKLAKLSLEFTSDAAAPGSSVLLNTTVGHYSVVQPVQEFVKDTAKPLTKLASKTIAVATHPISAVTGYVAGGMAGELFADKYITGVGQKIKDALMENITYETLYYSEETRLRIAQTNEAYETSAPSYGWNWLSSTASNVWARTSDIGGKLLYNGSLYSADLLGDNLAQSYVIKPLVSIALQNDRVN